MIKRRVGWDSLSKNSVRIFLVILWIILLTGLLISPKLASYAKGILQQANTFYLPIVFNNSVIAPLATPTVTGTPPTATLTFTPGPSPTNTISPSPTFTGTLTTIASMTMSVSPAPPNGATVGQNLTFTINVGNTGTGPTLNNILVDSFPTYLDVVSVTTTQGSVNKLTHSFIISIGNVNPNNVVTIVAIVRVNSTLSRNETTTNTAALTYNSVLSKTVSVSYKVILQTLPPTGELPLNWREDGFRPISLLPGILLIILGGFMLSTLLWWSRAREPKNKLWLTIAGALFLIVGFMLAISASGLYKPPMQAAQYSLTPTSVAAIAGEQSIGSSATTLPRLPASAFSTPDVVVPIVTLPDYPVPTPVLTVTPQPGEPGPDTSEITRIVIPLMMLDTEVKYVPYDGITWAITGLRQEVAWMGGTSWPGLGGNTGLAGHVTVTGMGDGPFRHLDELPTGELVLLYTEKNIYTYQVRESKVTNDDDMSVIQPTDKAQISLITCVDWDQAARTYLRRLVVVADLVSTEPLTVSMVP